MSEGGEYYIEFYRLGNLLKVSAIDPVTLKEGVVFGPATSSRSDLQKLAVKKLEWLIAKGS